MESTTVVAGCDDDGSVSESQSMGRLLAITATCVDCGHYSNNIQVWSDCLINTATNKITGCGCAHYRNSKITCALTCPNVDLNIMLQSRALELRYLSYLLVAAQTRLSLHPHSPRTDYWGRDWRITHSGLE